MRTSVAAILISSLSIAGLATLGGCETSGGAKRTPGNVTSSAGVPTAGASVPKDDHVLGGLVGGALGAGGGYLVGAQLSKSDEKHHDEAVQASHHAEQRPASASDVANSATADLNHDGYVTVDEIVAMKDAELSDQEIIRRLQATGQIFEVTAEQEQFLTKHGVTPVVVSRMRTLNQDVRDQVNRDRKAKSLATQAGTKL